MGIGWGGGLSEFQDFRKSLPITEMASSPKRKISFVIWLVQPKQLLILQLRRKVEVFLGSYTYRFFSHFKYFQIPRYLIIISPDPSYRSSHQSCPVKKDVLKNFANFTEKQLWWSHFLTKLQGCNFINNRLQYSCFHVKFANF